MADIIGTGFFIAIMLYMALFVTRALFLRLTWAWFAFAIAAAELVELHGGHVQWWSKLAVIAVGACLGALSMLRDECGQCTRYRVMWSAMREDVRRRFGRS
jgi:hypothetical protein